MDLGHTVVDVSSHDCDGKVNFNDRLRMAANHVGANFTILRITKEDVHRLVQDGWELLVSAGYPYRIPIGNSPLLRACNVHPTLLPEGRGPWPLPHRILRQCTTAEVTIHKLSSQFDQGDILCSAEFALGEQDNLESVSCKAQMLAPQLLASLVRDLEGHWFVPGHKVPARIGRCQIGPLEPWTGQREWMPWCGWRARLESSTRARRSTAKIGSFATLLVGKRRTRSARALWPIAQTVKLSLRW